MASWLLLTMLHGTDNGHKHKTWIYGYTKC